MSSNQAPDINILAHYLANPEIIDLLDCSQVDCIVICVSAVFYGAETVFKALEARPNLTKTLVLCGGIGHSTSLIYNAVSQSLKYHSIANGIEGLSEAHVLEKILRKFFDLPKIQSQGCKIIIEGKSTNCYLNALETKRLLASSGVPSLESCIVVQDPTMALRTTLCFRKVYEDSETPCKFTCHPGFVPRMEASVSGLEFAVDDIPSSQLWQKQRFYDLILGEIPRLRDDEKGYGPKGTNSIPHVDIPSEVEAAWARLKDNVTTNR